MINEFSKAVSMLMCSAILFFVLTQNVLSQQVNIYASGRNFSDASAFVENFRARLKAGEQIELLSIGSSAAIKLLCRSEDDPDLPYLGKITVALSAREIRRSDQEQCLANGVNLVHQKLPWTTGALNHFIFVRERDLESFELVRRIYDAALGRVSFPEPGIAAFEAWTTEFGDVFAESEIESWAVWRFGTPGTPGYGRIFIEGLAGVRFGRGSYSGYWMFYDTPDQPCSTQRTDLEGKSSRNYGPFEITFLDPDAPSQWTARWGACSGSPDKSWTGMPKIAGSGISSAASSAPTSPSGEREDEYLASSVQPDQFIVHVFSMSTEALAIDAINQVKRDNPDLSDVGYFVRKTIVNSREYWRVGLGPYDEREEANELCEQLRRDDIDCNTRTAEWFFK